MDLTDLNIPMLSIAFRKVYLPLVRDAASRRNHAEWMHTANDFELLIVNFEALIQEPDDLKDLKASKKASVANRSHPTRFASMRDEYVYWQTFIIEQSAQKRWMVHQWGEATVEVDASLRQAHYTLRLLRLVRDPIEMFSVHEPSVDKAGLYVKALCNTIKAVVLQPPSKAGVHSTFSDLVSGNTQLLAGWTRSVLRPRDLLKPEVVLVVSSLELWESEWATSKLEVVSKLTGQEFAAMFLATRTLLDSIRTVQSLIRETDALMIMVEQLEDFFCRQRLVALVRDELERRIDGLEMHLLLVEQRAEFAEFLKSFENVTQTVRNQVKTTIKEIIDRHSSFEGLKLLRKLLDASANLAGSHSGALDAFLAQHKSEQLQKLSTEVWLIRKGFDVTDYLNEAKEPGGVATDMAQKLFERRLLYHRVKICLLTIFPSPADWDVSPATLKIKEQYIELAKYLKTTEEKLHQKWFSAVQRRANAAMANPILKKATKGYITTLQDTLMTLWDETRLFLQTRFQVPHVCHVLLMQKPDFVHYNRALVAVLERLDSTVRNLTPFEFTVLNGSYSLVENALILGTTRISWPSLCLPSYIHELMESVERFRSMAQDVQLVTGVMEKELSKIHHHRLFVGQRISSALTQESSAEGFFKRLNQSGDEFFIDVSRVVEALPPVLLQVESLVCSSQTGCAPELQNYYDHWRERIYATVLESLDRRFLELSALIENGPAQFTVHVFLQDGRVVVQPPLESIEQEFENIVQHWIGKSRLVPSWGEGSCVSLSAGKNAIHDRLKGEPSLKLTIKRDQELCKRLVDKLRQIIKQWADCSALWEMDKERACRELRATSPALWQYDEQLQYYRHYWTARVSELDEQTDISCLVLQMHRLKAVVLAHIDEWITRLGATWLADLEEKLVRLEGLMSMRSQLPADCCDGSVDIDIEMLSNEIGESWHRLAHYGIKVPSESTAKHRLMTATDERGAKAAPPPPSKPAERKRIE